MRSSKVIVAVLGCLFLVAIATVQAAEHKKETEYCRNARKECEEKCKNMDMNFKCKDAGEGARAAACSCSSKGSSSSSHSSASSTSSASAAGCASEGCAGIATAKTSPDSQNLEKEVQNHQILA